MLLSFKQTLTDFDLLRKGSLWEEHNRVYALKPTKEGACDLFTSCLQSFLPRSQKIKVKDRDLWRQKIDRALPAELRPPKLYPKFPFAIYQDNSMLPEMISREDAVRALVLRSSGIIKKRYSCLPSIVIASTPSSRKDLEDIQSCVHKCYFGINPLSCVWFMSCLVDQGH